MTVGKSSTTKAWIWKAIHFMQLLNVYCQPRVTKMRDMIVLLGEKDVFPVIKNHRISQGLCDGIRVYSSLVLFFFFKEREL